MAQFRVNQMPPPNQGRGVKLARQKSSIPVIVVDHVEENPIE